MTKSRGWRPDADTTICGIATGSLVVSDEGPVVDGHRMTSAATLRGEHDRFIMGEICSYSEQMGRLPGDIADVAQNCRLFVATQIKGYAKTRSKPCTYLRKMTRYSLYKQMPRLGLVRLAHNQGKEAALYKTEWIDDVPEWMGDGAANDSRLARLGMVVDPGQEPAADARMALRRARRYLDAMPAGVRRSVVAWRLAWLGGAALEQTTDEVGRRLGVTGQRVRQIVRDDMPPVLAVMRGGVE